MLDERLNAPSYTFTYPFSIRFAFFLAGLVCAAMAWMAWNNLTQAFRLPGTALLAGLAITALLYYWRTSAQVTVSAESIRRQAAFGRKSSLRWPDLAEIHTGAMDPSLVLSDRAGSVRIRIDPYIQGYQTILDMVRRARPDLWTVFSQPATFHRSPRSAMLGAALALALLAPGMSNLMDGRFLGAGVLLGLGILVGALVLRQPVQVSFNTCCLEVRYLVGLRRIPAEAIRDVQLREAEGTQAERASAVLVLLKGSRVLELAGFREGAPEIYQTLRAWWKKITKTVEG